MPYVGTDFEPLDLTIAALFSSSGGETEDWRHYYVHMWDPGYMASFFLSLFFFPIM